MTDLFTDSQRPADNQRPRTKADIARENGAKSRGPITPEGKARSSYNSFRHGLTSKTIVLCYESTDRLNTLYARYRNTWQAENEIEEDLIEEMAVSKWQERRSWGLETAALDAEVSKTAAELEAQFKEVDPRLRTQYGFQHLADNSNFLQLLLRYRNSHIRNYYRAMDQIIKLRTKGVLKNAPADPEPAWDESESDPSGPPAEPQNDPQQDVQRNEPSTAPNSNTTNDQPSSSNAQPSSINAQPSTNQTPDRPRNTAMIVELPSRPASNGPQRPFRSEN